MYDGLYQRSRDEIELTAGEIADFLNTEYIGTDANVSGFNSIDDAKPGDITFWEGTEHQPIQDSDASIVVCSPQSATEADATQILTSNPRIDFMKLVKEFFTEPRAEEQIHPTATVESEAELGANCYIGPHAHVSAGVSIGDNSYIGASTYIDGNVHIGDRCVIQSNASIGEPALSYRRDENGELIREVHDGTVKIEDDVDIGVGSIVDRAMFKTTTVGRGTKIGRNVYIAHQSQIEESVWISSATVIAGSVTVHPYARIYLGARIAPYLDIGAEAEVGMGAVVLEDVQPHARVVGSPAKPVE